MNHLRCFYFKELLPSDKLVVIRDDEFHHMIHVDRLAKGDLCLLSNGKGLQAVCELKQFDKKSVDLEIREFLEQKAPARPFITVYQGVPRHQKFSLLTEKAQELGVTTLVPLITERNTVKVSKGDKFVEKQEKVLISALKQSHGAFLTQITQPKKISELSLNQEETKCRLLMDPFEGESFFNYFYQVKQLDLLLKDGEVEVFIGPEGGFSEEEKKNLIKQGCQKIYLKGAVLRSETAFISICSLLRYVLGDLENIK